MIKTITKIFLWLILGTSLFLTSSKNYKRYKPISLDDPCYYKLYIKPLKKADFFKEEVKSAIKGLKRKNYTILITAKWCRPCRELEKDLKELALEDKVEKIIYIDGLSQTNYLIRSLKRKGVYIDGSVPKLITRLNNNKVYVFSGYNSDEKAMYYRWDLKKLGSKIRLEKILK